jgi:hypothetical protein
MARYTEEDNLSDNPSLIVTAILWFLIGVFTVFLWKIFR